MSHIASDYICIHRHMVETVNRMSVPYRCRQQCLTAPEVTNYVPRAFHTPADQFFVRHHGPILPRFSIQAVIHLPLFGIGLKAGMGNITATLVPATVEPGKIPIGSVGGCRCPIY